MLEKQQRITIAKSMRWIKTKWGKKEEENKDSIGNGRSDPSQKSQQP